MVEKLREMLGDEAETKRFENESSFWVGRSFRDTHTHVCINKVE